MQGIHGFDVVASGSFAIFMLLCVGVVVVGAFVEVFQLIFKKKRS